MYRTVVKLNPLPDTDPPGAEHQHLLAVFCMQCLILAAKYRIIIRRRGFKLSRTGIYHFKCRSNSVFVTHGTDFLLAPACQGRYDMIRELYALCLF